uniref:Uncharacterized protein n=1 Tax=Arundo donax TaxID=35708 RepID=A0A0A9A8J5_ARUDO
MSIHALASNQQIVCHNIRIYSTPSHLVQQSHCLIHLPLITEAPDQPIICPNIRLAPFQLHGLKHPHCITHPPLPAVGIHNSSASHNTRR